MEFIYIYIYDISHTVFQASSFRPHVSLFFWGGGLGGGGGDMFFAFFLRSSQKEN